MIDGERKFVDEVCKEREREKFHIFIHVRSPESKCLKSLKRKEKKTHYFLRKGGEYKTHSRT